MKAAQMQKLESYAQAGRFGKSFAAPETISRRLIERH